MSMTANIRLKLRTKISGPVTDYSQLYNRELVFGNTEKSLFIRDYTGNTIFQFLNVNDSTTSLFSNWSSDKISTYIAENYSAIDHTHDYYDIENIPKRNIFLSPSGMTPHSNSLIACDSPIVSTNTVITRWETNFTESKVGFYTLLVPTDYKDSITKISLCFSSDGTGDVTWAILGGALNAGLAIDTSSFSYNSISIDSTVIDINTFIYADWTGTFDLFGSDSVDKLTPIFITLSSSFNPSANFKFYGAKIEYI